MTIRFYIDPETGLPHIYGHAVDETEVEEVLRAPGKIAQVEKGLEWRLDKHELVVISV